MFAPILVLIALVTPSFAVYANETILYCQGESQSTNLLDGKRSAPVAEEQVLKIKCDANSVYLALSNGAFIETRAADEILSYAEVPNMIGTRSLSYNLSTGAIRYEAVATRHGEPIGAYLFSGSCSAGG
ncbi:MAG: hypothetical protein V7746_02430 [Halioglobus sp.]